MKFYLFFLLTLSSLSVYSQSNVWYPFETETEDEEEALIGYKDKDGKIMIEPRFNGVLMSLIPFTEIVAVEEDIEDKHVSYYITKDGRKFGQDSMYIFDTAFDCEREGFIRFQPKGREKTGLFNKKGEVVIPADYNYLSEVNNGFVVGLKNARKEYLDDGHNGNGGCNHWRWVDGIEYLLDTANTILVENFKYNPNIDFYSINIENNQSADTLRDSYLGVNGKYYTFVNNEKAFKYWLFEDFLKNFSKENLTEKSLKFISWSDKSHDGVTENKELIESNYNSIKNSIFEVLKDNCDYQIFLDEDFRLNTESDMIGSFDDYYDNCGNLKFHQYPKFELIINHYDKNGKNDFQESFDFIKIGNKYKLSGLSLSEANFKIRNK